MDYQRMPIRHIDSIIECPICSEVCTHPRTLPCIHTFCLKCLHGWFEDKQPGDEIACPLCCKSFLVPVNGLAGLPKNFFVEKLAKAKQRPADAEASKHGRCDGCSGAELSADDAQEAKQATVYCPECRLNLCETCEKYHGKMKESRMHRLLSVDDENLLRNDDEVQQPVVVPPPTSSLCEKHPDERLRCYCADCRSTICRLCFDDSHSEHACIPVKDISRVFRVKLENDTGNVTTAVELCRQMLADLDKEKEKFVEQTGAAEQQIRDRAERIKDEIERHVQTLVDQLDEIRQERLTRLTRLIADIERHLAAMKYFRKYTNEVLSKGRSCDVAQAASSLHDRANELLEFEPIERAIDELRHADVTFTSSKLTLDDAKVTLGEVVTTWSNQAILESTSPRLSHVLPKGDYVYAVTSLGNHVFVVCHSSQDVEDYDAETLDLQRRLVVPDLGLESYGLAACDRNSCLYVSDYYSHTVHRVQLDAGAEVTRWAVARYPAGLSVNDAGRVLVACSGTKTIQEYTTDGRLMRQVNLQAAVTNPWHCIQLANGQFLISQYSSKGSVSLVASDGRIIRSYGCQETTNPPSSTPSVGDQILLKYPSGLAVSVDGHVLVADSRNNKVVVIDPEMTQGHELTLPIVGGPQRPYGLCLDESRGRLYVAECDGGRVLVFDNIIDLSH